MVRVIINLINFSERAEGDCSESTVRAQRVQRASTLNLRPDHRYSASEETFPSGSPLHCRPLKRALESADATQSLPKYLIQSTQTRVGNTRLDDSTAAQPSIFY